MNLDEKFENAFHCYTFYENEQKTLFAEKNRGREQRDRDSILGTYCRLNPALQTPAMYHQMFGQNQIVVFLPSTAQGRIPCEYILVGKITKIERNDCVLCNDDIQTIDHILFHCKVTKTLEILSIKKIMTYKIMLKIQIIRTRQAYYVVWNIHCTSRIWYFKYLDG